MDELSWINYIDEKKNSTFIGKPFQNRLKLRKLKSDIWKTNFLFGSTPRHICIPIFTYPALLEVT